MMVLHSRSGLNAINTARMLLNPTDDYVQPNICNFSESVRPQTTGVRLLALELYCPIGSGNRDYTQIIGILN